MATPESFTGYHPESITGYHPESITGYHPESITGYHPESITGYHPESITGYHPESITGYHPESITGLRQIVDGIHPSPPCHSRENGNPFIRENQFPERSTAKSKCLLLPRPSCLTCRMDFFARTTYFSKFPKCQFFRLPH